MHQIVPGDRRGLRQQMNAPAFAVRIGLPVALVLRCDQSIQQLVDRPAGGLSDWLHKQDHVAAGIQRGHGGIDRRPGHLGAFHAQVVAEDGTSEPSC